MTIDPNWANWTAVAILVVVFMAGAWCIVKEGRSTALALVALAINPGFWLFVLFLALGVHKGW